MADKDDVKEFRLLYEDIEQAKKRFQEVVKDLSSSEADVHNNVAEIVKKHKLEIPQNSLFTKILGWSASRYFLTPLCIKDQFFTSEVFLSSVLPSNLLYDPYYLWSIQYFDNDNFILGKHGAKTKINFQNAALQVLMYDVHCFKDKEHNQFVASLFKDLFRTADVEKIAQSMDSPPDKPFTDDIIGEVLSRIKNINDKNRKGKLWRHGLIFSFWETIVYLASMNICEMSKYIEECIAVNRFEMAIDCIPENFLEVLLNNDNIISPKPAWLFTNGETEHLFHHSQNDGKGYINAEIYLIYETIKKFLNSPTLENEIEVFKVIPPEVFRDKWALSLTSIIKEAKTEISNNILDKLRMSHKKILLTDIDTLENDQEANLDLSQQEIEEVLDFFLKRT